MSLQFGHPALWAGLVLLALPVLAHLVGARQARRIPFPAIRFIGQAQQTLRRRWLLEDLLLLLVRALAIAALVTMFTRPTVLHPVRVSLESLPVMPTALVIDRSLSTRVLTEEMVFERIRSRARRIVAELDPEVPLTVVLADHRAIQLPAGGGRDDLDAELAALLPGHGGTDLEGALSLARELLLEAGSAGHVIVLSDGTATRLPAAVTGGWPEEIAVTYMDLATEPAANRYVTEIHVEDGVDPALGLPVNVELSATLPPSEPMTLDLVLDGQPPLHGWVDDDDRVELGWSKRFTVVDLPAGLGRAETVLGPDALAEDNRVPFFLSGSSALKVHILSGEGGASVRDDEVYYLTTALRPRDMEGPSIEPRVITVDELAGLPAHPGTVLLVCNMPGVDRFAHELERLVRGGAGVLISVGSRVDRDAYRALEPLLPSMLGAVKARGRTTFETTTVGLVTPDLQEPLWRPFREGGRSTFARVHFEHVMEVEPELAPDSSVLLRYSDGRAALLERRFGDGRVLLFTSTLDDDWSDLPIRAIYLPMVHQLVRYLAGELTERGGTSHRIGERLTSPPLECTAGNLELYEPDGRVTPLGDCQAGLRLELPGQEQPGHYQVMHLKPGESGVPEPVWSLCVRTDPAESALEPLDRATLAAAIPTVVFVESGGEAGKGERATVMRQTSLVPAAVVLLLLALLAETLLGGRRR